MSEHRNRKTDLYKPLCDVFCRRINRIIEKSSKKRTNKNISEYTGASATTVAKWLSGKALPSLDQLYKLADCFEVSVIELLNDDSSRELLGYRDMLYGDAFILLYNLIKDGVLAESSVNDYFLKYLISEAIWIDANDNLSYNKKEDWYQKVQNDFSIHVFDKHFLDIYLNAAIDAFTEVAEYDSYVSCAKGLDAWRNVLDSSEKAPSVDEAPEDELYEGGLDDFSYKPFYEWLHEYKTDI